VDRYGVMRPTRKIPNGKLSPVKTRTSVELLQSDSKDLQVDDKPDWKSASAWTHWDLNPWKWTMHKGEGDEYKFDNFITENNGVKNTGDLKLQGLIVLCDSRDQDGGFCTVPGFHKHLAEWANLTKDTKYPARAEFTHDFVTVPNEDNLHKLLKNITARAGSLIIWRSEQPHCNYPNDSERFRFNIYIKMFPAHNGAPGTKARMNDLLSILPADFKNWVTPLGSKLLGLTSWED